MYSVYGAMILLIADCSIRTSPDQSLFATPRSFSQLTTSFVGSQCQGIRPAPFVAWPYSGIMLCSPTKESFVFIWNCSHFTPLTFLFIKVNVVSFDLLHFAFTFLFSFQSTLLQLSSQRIVVGSSGLEPPTSRLSGVRSNHLSYEPIMVEMNRIELSTPCLQSRCSPSWATPPRLVGY